MAKVHLNGESCMALLDNGVQINTSMPNYVKNHSCVVRLITDLIGARVTCMGLRNAYTQTLGYVNFLVQVEGGLGYDEDQIALVVPDLLNFAEWIPVNIGNPHYRPHCKCYERERNRCLGQMPGWPISCQYIESQPQW